MRQSICLVRHNACLLRCARWHLLCDKASLACGRLFLFYSCDKAFAACEQAFACANRHLFVRTGICVCELTLACFAAQAGIVVRPVSFSFLFVRPAFACATSDNTCATWKVLSCEQALSCATWHIFVCDKHIALRAWLSLRSALFCIVVQLNPAIGGLELLRSSATPARWKLLCFVYSFHSVDGSFLTISFIPLESIQHFIIVRCAHNIQC